jgi:Tol biopolymer transport system component
MKAEAVALALGMMLTVEQRDAHRSMFERSSPAVSADGRFVAFTSYSQLATADTNSSTDVYVLDRNTQRVTLESANTGQYTGSSAHPSISGDGRYVVFERANVVMLRDRREGVTRIVGEGNHPTITQNGRHLLFGAGSVDRVADADVNGDRTDVYVTDLQSGQTRRVSVEMKGLDASLTASDHPAASSDGRFVAFVTRTQTPGTRAFEPQVFVRDTELQTTRHVGAGWDASISGDGRFVSFVGRENRLPHIFLADLHTGASRAITKSVRRGLANGASGKPKISSDGRFVVFQSEASDLIVADDFNLLWDVFVFDRTTGATTRVSGDAEGEWMESSAGPSIDARGSVVAFSSRHPTDASDKRNDFDLYVVTIGYPNTVSMSPPQRRRDAEIFLRNSLRLSASAVRHRNAISLASTSHRLY